MTIPEYPQKYNIADAHEVIIIQNINHMTTYNIAPHDRKDQHEDTAYDTDKFIPYRKVDLMLKAVQEIIHHV
jgi:hypothetical protein